jgi:hypothetical protein
MQRGSRLRRKCEERSVEALSFAYAHKTGCPIGGGFTGGPLRTHPACPTVTAKSPQRPCCIVSTPTNLHQSYGRAAIHPLFGLSRDAPGVKEPTLVAKNATRMGHPRTCSDQVRHDRSWICVLSTRLQVSNLMKLCWWFFAFALCVLLIVGGSAL